MIITDINGNVARREFDFSSSGPSPSSSRPIATSSAPSAPPVSNAVAPASIPISTQSIVGLRCYYTTPDPNILALLGTSTFSSQLTGVVVNPDGYILTAKHGVDPQWVSQIVLASSSAQVIFSQSVFKYCDVGVPPESYSLPTWQQIQALNPGEPLGPMRYTASLYFDPSSSTMSEQEYHETDFAILKINGVANGCSTWYPDCTLPSQFPYSPVFSAVPPVRSQLLTYGYPVEAESDYQNQFYLKGAFGHVSSFDYGDTYFSTTALALHWSADDIMGGRSGSPLYWNGYVVGVLSNRNVDEATSTAVAMPAIEKVLQNNGLGNLLMTK